MKPLLKAPPRIQRFLLRLHRYDFQIEYAPGKTVVVADTLSRAFLPNNSPEITEDEMKCHIHVVMQHLPMSPKKMMQYQQETKNDEVLNIVSGYIREGWPLSKKEVTLAAQPYYSERDHITTVNGLIFKSDRLIVPSTLRKEAIHCIHSGHQGTGRCLMRVCDSVYWPGITNQIKLIITSCSHCLDYRNKQSAETSIPHEIPDVPWLKLALIYYTYEERVM